jgi:hypothetical protein
MKKILKGVELKHVPLWRIVLVAAIGFVAFVIVLCLVSLAVRSGLSQRHADSAQFNPVYEQTVPDASGGSSAWSKQGSGLSMPEARSSMPFVSRDEWAPGTDAEKYEVDDYAALIRTTKLDRVCDSLSSWHEYDYVIFESSQRNPHSCSFRFKVPEEDTAGVARALEELNPVEFTSTSQTVKKQLRDYANEEAILNDQLAAIKATMNEADAQYEELMRIAAKSENSDMIAQAVQNRMEQIERLSQEAQAVAAQLASIQQRKTDDQDQTKYSFFTVRVRDYNIVDTVVLRDAWVRHMQEFVLRVNDILAGITLGMLGFLLRVVEIGFYLGIILILAKVGYQLFKKLWHEKA